MASAARRSQQGRRLALLPGNRDAGTSLGNPDIRVPDRPKREDGHPRGTYMDDEEDAEGTGREEEGECTEDEERKTNHDGSRNGNSAVLKKAADQQGTEENGDTRADRHAPGGTWLTKTVRQDPRVSERFTTV
ncbi:hypothetical protein NDU88_002058 [Pleurodeles waltl]|uniref:Uncharacterized protein n=1 Tax=Pleurodeles waltl TaxID=8319 RepID=A0AAV7PE90_PLEWA|nr:hypothetical protein NDU88_002058 [Pleurodeles waltl]